MNYKRRRCVICNTKYTPRQYNQMLCGSFDCRAEYLRLRSNGLWELLDLPHIVVSAGQQERVRQRREYGKQTG